MALVEPSPADRAILSRIYSFWAEQNFHCARAVLEQLAIPAEQEMLDAVSAFMGGTLFMGMTCSAFAAGVMAVGLRSGEIENSPPKVIRMLYRMTTGGDAFDESINKFNRSMNAGYRMSRWFINEFGSTQCQSITRCDLSTIEGVSQYRQGNCVTKCKLIAHRMAEEVESTLHTLQQTPGAQEQG